MTTANKVTIVRILLVPFFIAQMLYYAVYGGEWHRWLAVLSFSVASLSDGIDGYIARRYNQRSELGAILDPLADKLLLISGIVLLTLDTAPHFHRIPIWLTTTILSRDVLVLIGMAVIHFVCGRVTVQARLTGKLATVLQMGTILWILLKWDPRWLTAWVWAAGAFTAVSGGFYVWDGVRQLASSPHSSAKPQQSTH